MVAFVREKLTDRCITDISEELVSMVEYIRITRDFFRWEKISEELVSMVVYDGVWGIIHTHMPMISEELVSMVEYYDRICRLSVRQDFRRTS